VHQQWMGPLTFSENQYWSTLETTKRYVYKILLPYLNFALKNIIFSKFSEDILKEQAQLELSMGMN